MSVIYEAEVVSGKGRGRRIGFPTINLSIPENLGATHGIYAGWVIIGDKRHPAAFHYGPIPTFHEVTPTLEAYILDSHLTQPPRQVQFELVAHVRDVKTFLNAEELAVAIKSDVEDVKKILKTHKD